MRFVETMRGWLEASDGRVHPISFDVRATATGRPGHFKLEGLVFAPPWAPEALAEGTLTFALGPASLSYALSFEGLSLEAVKHPSLLAPIRGMSEMETRLYRSGAPRGSRVQDRGPAAQGDDRVDAPAERELLARGVMRFDLRDLPPFLASFFPPRSRAERRLDAGCRQLERRALLADGGPA